MIMSKVELRVFNPRAQVENIPQISASPRLSDIADKKIALFKNRVPVGEIFFLMVGEGQHSVGYRNGLWKNIKQILRL